MYSGLNLGGTPFTGYGRKRGSMITVGTGPGATPTDEYGMVNYTYFAASGDAVPQRTPEMFGGTPVAGNVNYTYPDENNMFLAAVDPVSGRVMVPSFDRPWNYTGTDFTNTVGKYKMLRPRPADHAYDSGDGRGKVSDFPYPTQVSWTDANGTQYGYYADVENLPGKVGGTQKDSLWMDLDLPVTTWKGKKCKPLVAFLIVDHDGRVNLNVAGNARGTGNASVSNQGWGPWEINPTAGNIIPAQDLQTLLGGTGGTPGRYGLLAQPLTSPVGPHKRSLVYAAQSMSTPNGEQFNNMPASGTAPPFYALVDFDGSGAKNAAQSWRRPLSVGGTDTNPSGRPSGAASGGFEAFTVWGNGYNIASIAANPNVRNNHPLLFSPYFRPAKPASNSDDRVFPLEDLFALNRRFQPLYDNTGTGQLAFSNTTLGKLAPNSLGAVTPSGSPNPRWLTTTLSHDIDRPGGTGWLTAPAGTAGSDYQLPSNSIGNPPTGTATPGPAAASSGEFDAQLGSVSAALGAIDLNRKLADYRADPSLTDMTTGGPMWDGNVTAASAAAADADRQAFAKDIFDRLVLATGAANINANPPPASGTPQFNALRWLAQLAANIVDYIDNDDVMTRFTWNPNGKTVTDQVVVGTEVPRLVLNEAYFRCENDPNDPALVFHPKTKKYTPNVQQNDSTVYPWFELAQPADAGHPGRRQPVAERRAGQTGVQRGQFGLPAARDPPQRGHGRGEQHSRTG